MDRDELEWNKITLNMFHVLENDALALPSPRTFNITTINNVNTRICTAWCALDIYVHNFTRESKNFVFPLRILIIFI